MFYPSVTDRYSQLQLHFSTDFSCDCDSECRSKFCIWGLPTAICNRNTKNKRCSKQKCTKGEVIHGTLVNLRKGSVGMWHWGLQYQNSMFDMEFEQKVGQDGLFQPTLSYDVWVSHILTTREFVSLSSYQSSHLNRTETNKIFHVALNHSTGEVLDSPDQALLLPLMETCWLQVTALWTGRSNTVSDRLRKWNNHLHILLYDFFLWENMKVKCGGQVQGDWN